MIFKQPSKPTPPLALSDLLSSLHTSPSFRLISTDSLAPLSSRPLDISITSSECMRSSLIDKQEVFHSLRDLTIMNVLGKVFERVKKREVMNQWRGRVKERRNEENVYLKAMLEGMVTGVVRLGIILERKMRFAKHKCFIEVKNTEEKEGKICEIGHVGNQNGQQPVFELENLPSLDCNLPQHQPYTISTKNLLPQPNQIFLSSQSYCVINKILSSLSHIRTRNLSDSFRKIFEKAEQIEKMEFLMKTMERVHRIFKGYFYLGAWKMIKKEGVEEVKKRKQEFIEEFRTVLNISPKPTNLQQNVNNSQNMKDQIKCQQINHSLFPCKQSKVLDLNLHPLKSPQTPSNNTHLDQSLHLPYSSPTTLTNQNHNPNLSPDSLPETLNDLPSSFISSPPTLKPILKFPPLSSVLPNKLSPKYSIKSSASKFSQNILKKTAGKIRSQVKDHVNGYAPKVFLSPPAKYFTKQPETINEYYISNNGYVPTSKRTVKSPVNPAKPVAPSSPSLLSKPLKPSSSKHLPSFKSPLRKI